MLDPKILRDDIEQVASLLAKRHLTLDVETIKALEKNRKACQIKTETLQQQRNRYSKKIGQAKAQGQDTQELLAKVATLADELNSSKFELAQIQQELNEIITGIPNITDASVPEGESEEDNKQIKTWGKLPQFNFQPKDHVDLGTLLKLLDFESATKISGSRFVVMRGGVARLHRALIQFMLDVHTKEHGYQEINVPLIVNSDTLFGTGQLPKFKEDVFAIAYNKISDTDKQEEMFLIPTAEVPVTNMVGSEIIDSDALPIKYVCHSPCFRSEVGSYGKDTRGMIRQHQFEKVELVQIVRPETSYDALEELTGHAEKILQMLELPYRVMLLCGKDIGFASAKTYDLEVWLPGQNRYREISSCSNCEEFQTRRMKARWRNIDTGQIEFLHTLNGSGLAVGRTLVAIMENYQNEKGGIRIPEVLQPYMDNLTILPAPAP